MYHHETRCSVKWKLGVFEGLCVTLWIYQTAQNTIHTINVGVRGNFT